MSIARTVLTLMLCAVCVVCGDQTDSVVHVCGDVPKPGPITFEGEGMTIDSAMEAVGMDLRPFYAQEDGDNDGFRCPIKVVVFRKGKRTIYDPIIDSAAIQGLPLELNDTIEVSDIRQHPKKIKARELRIEKMLELGSTVIVNELLLLAALKYEYDEWRVHADATPAGSVVHLKKEAARLVEQGKGQRVIGIIDLKLGALQLEGLGSGHPTMKEIIRLRQIYRDLVPE
jgi:hypothetical protein